MTPSSTGMGVVDALADATLELSEELKRTREAYMTELDRLELEP